MRFAIAILFLLTLQAQAVDVFPVSRRGGLPNNLWTSAGISGGIPAVTTIFTNLSAGVTVAQINTAIQNCPSNQVVKLAAGTYNLGNGVVILNKNGVVLRGSTNAAGFPTTILNNVAFQNTSYYYPGGGGGGWPAVSIRNISSGLTEGSSTITLSSAPGSDFAVGDVFFIDQLDDNVVVKPDNQHDLFKRDGRSYQEVLHCTNISGNNISFEPPLLGEYWSGSLTPQAVGWSSQLGHSTQRAGFEDININTANGAIYTVQMNAGYQCWVKNMVLQAVYASGLRASYLVNSEVRHCIFRDSTGTGSGTYAMIAGVDTACRFEDNAFTNLSLAMPINSLVGCTCSYNFGNGPYPYSPAGWFAEYIFTHGGHPHHNLFEGNYFEGPLYFDYLYLSSSTDNGVVRNRIVGATPTKSSDRTPLAIQGFQYNITVLGNILGQSGIHTAYEGIRSDGQDGQDGVIYSRALSSTNLIRTNNYNTVTGGIPPSEAMVGTTMRDSYAYDSKPAWFGDRPWPPYSPDNSANAYATNIPAGYRVTFQTDVPTGAVDQIAPTISAESTNSITTSSFVSRFITDETATGFVLYGLTPSLGSTVTGSSGLSNNITVSGLSAGTTYYFKNGATDSAGNTTNSSLFQVVTLPPADTAAPVISAVSTNSVTNNAYTVTWTTDEPAKGQVDFGPTSSYGQSVTESSFTTSHSLRVSGVPANAVSHFRVHECDVLNNCTNDVDRTVTTTLDPDVTPPSFASTNISVTINSATVTWTSGEASDTVLFWGLDTNYGNSQGSTNLVTSHSSQIVNLQPSTLYYLKMQQTDAAGNQTNKTASFTTSAPSTNNYNGPSITLKVIR